MSSRHGDALDMAEFKAIVTASFDDIGSNVALNNNNNNIRALHPARLAPPSSEDKTARRSSPFSFLRKVKSHAASLLVSQSRPVSAPPSHSHSFVPSLPSRQPAPAPFASRNLFTRALGKSTHTPHVPDLEPKSFFFDDDEDKVDRRQMRRISARPNARLSSAFAAAPVLFGLTSPSASTPYLVSEKHDESRADLVHVCAHLLLGPFSLTFFYADIQTVTKTQASYKTLPPKASIAPFQSIFSLEQFFSSYAILPYSPLLHRLRRRRTYSSMPCIAWRSLDHPGRRSFPQR
jgi:hypothetical protein